jgi:branched-chain amino acid transport system substrate-binding protein
MNLGVILSEAKDLLAMIDRPRTILRFAQDDTHVHPRFTGVWTVPRFRMTGAMAVALLIIIIFILLLLSCHAPEKTAAPRIGLIAGLSGPTAAYGTACRRGAELAIDDIRASGQNIELKIEDDQGSPEQTANVAAALMADPSIVAIVGADTSSGTMAMAPLAESNRIAIVSPTASAPAVTRGRHFVFRVCATDDGEAAAAAQLARDRLHAARAVILRDTKNDYSVGIAETFAKSFGARGGSVAGVFDYAAADSDFRGQLTSAKALAPDVIVVPGYYGDVAQIAIQARDMGITVPLLGGSGWDSPKLTEIGGKVIDGNWFVSWLRSPSAKFVAAFRKQYGTDPDGANAQAYDAISLVADAVKRAGAKRGAVRNAIAGTRNFDGVSGRITIGPDGNAKKALGVFRVEGGKFVQVGSY